MERMEFHPNSRLRKINACPNEKDCGLYDFVMVEGRGLKLVRNSYQTNFQVCDFPTIRPSGWGYLHGSPDLLLPHLQKFRPGKPHWIVIMSAVARTIAVRLTGFGN